jgi:hypothetical protein
VNRFIVCAGLAALCVFSLAGCIDSAQPILTDAQPLFGPHVRFQFYGLYKSAAVDPEQADYVWQDGTMPMPAAA